jgi:hypothetical protein
LQLGKNGMVRGSATRRGRSARAPGPSWNWVSRVPADRSFGEIATLDDLPLFTSEKIIDSIRNIDVLCTAN